MTQCDYLVSRLGFALRRTSSSVDRITERMLWGADAPASCRIQDRVDGSVGTPSIGCRSCPGRRSLAIDHNNARGGCAG